MSIQDWAAVIALIFTGMGGVVWFIRVMIRQELAAFKQELQNDQIKKLEHENEKLRDRVSQTK